ncbi:hypothetical protein [Lacticaseibacillus nasuensis]|nr:hypothetical protein [Lacticaseibacillus nasuensis]MCX2454881.1 hypothetical protein [Lacticaseibacillus nasuensis]
MGSLIAIFWYLLMFGAAFLVIALAVKYGVLWAVRALSEDELNKLNRFKR